MVINMGQAASPGGGAQAAVNPPLESLLKRFEEGDQAALARLITLVENHAPARNAIIERIYAKTGRAHIVGVTGPPGVGKSTLINLLVAGLRADGRRVAVLAIDPSSPFSGGAVLGDRIRMTGHYGDAGVYIRSISSRGSRGGLSRAAREVVKLLDAFGHAMVIIETVGAGQTELAIMDLADTTVVVAAPEGGDAVQAMKAGLNEIADIFVVNKAEHEGAGRIKAELELNAQLRPAAGWHPPVVMTQALAGQGVDTLLDAISRHAAYLSAHRDAARQGERRMHEFIEALAGELEDRAVRAVQSAGLAALVSDVRGGRLNPYQAARLLLEEPVSLAELLGGAPNEAD